MKNLVIPLPLQARVSPYPSICVGNSGIRAALPKAWRLQETKPLWIHFIPGTGSEKDMVGGA